MLVEFLLAGLAVAGLLLLFGFFGNEKRIFLIVGAGLVLIITGLFVASDSTGIEIQTYGGCVNQSIEVFEYENFTQPEAGKWGAEVVNITTNYTYGPCYAESIGFNYTQLITIVLILMGLGLLLGIWQWTRFKETDSI